MARFWMDGAKVRIIELAKDGFNELAFCRDGPMVFNKNDLYVGKSLMLYGEYCVEEMELFRRVIKPTDHVMEVGANIGAHTVGLSRMAAGVQAIEPQKLAFQALCANLALNQCENVSTHQVGLGASVDRATMQRLNPREAANIGAVELTPIYALADDPPLARMPVVVVPLDAMNQVKLDFLKIDVEGMERDVLDGGANTIEQHRPVIYCENDRPEKSEALINWLRNAGYSLYWHLPRLFNPNNFFGHGINVFPGVVSVNMLCLPNTEPPPMHLQAVGAANEPWPQGKQLM